MELLTQILQMRPPQFGQSISCCQFTAATPSIESVSIATNTRCRMSGLRLHV